MNFLGKFTPLGEHRTITVGGGQDLLSTLLGGLPQGATGVWIQCAQPGEVLHFWLDGTAGGVSPLSIEYPAILELTNGPQLAACVVSAPSDIQLQLFTGSAGALF